MAASFKVNDPILEGLILRLGSAAVVLIFLRLGKKKAVYAELCCAARKQPVTFFFFLAPHSPSPSFLPPHSILFSPSLFGFSTPATKNLHSSGILMLMIKHLGQPGTRVLASSSSPRFCPLNAFKYATAASVSTRAKTAPRKLSPSTPPVVAVLSSSTTSAANHHASSGRGPSNGKIRVMGGYTVAGSYSWGSSRTLPSKSAGPLIYPLGSPDFPPPMETGPDGYPYLDFRTKNSRSVYYTSDNEKADQWLHGNA